MQDYCPPLLRGHGELLARGERTAAMLRLPAPCSLPFQPLSLLRPIVIDIDTDDIDIGR